MKITDTADRPCRAGHWYSYDTAHGPDYIFHSYGIRRSVYHYGTCMLTFELQQNKHGQLTWDGNPESVWTNEGRGSVSDQGGLNKIFKHLWMPFRYDRAGGARIVYLLEWWDEYRDRAMQDLGRA